MKREWLDDAPDLLKEFIGYEGTVRGRSPKTVEEYYLDLRTFFRYLKHKKGLVPRETDLSEIPIADLSQEVILSVTLTDIFEYMNYLMSECERPQVCARFINSSPIRNIYLKFPLLSSLKHLNRKNLCQSI